MFDTLRQFLSQDDSWWTIALNLGLLLIFAILSYGVCRLLTYHLVRGLLRDKKQFKSVLADSKTLRQLCRIVPWVIVQVCIDLIPHLTSTFSTTVHNLATAMILLHGILAIGAFLDGIIVFYTLNNNTRTRSIKSYIQLAKLVIYVLGAICIIATLIDRSPVILISGLGAMSAVTMLVFKDTILSFVAGVQISSNDMLRLGDWIEMPQVGADGDVIDIALQVVKVQNWDKTITTIPTWRLMSESFKNWRGMQESGGRRIKRAIKIDVSSIGFVTPEQFQKLSSICVLKDYLADKRVEIESYNARLGEDAQMTANRRRLTNVGTFRAYALAYLKSHPRVNQTMTCMVRQMDPSSEGLPMEIYCFTNTTVWADYEGIQGDIFDHLISILPEFGLRVFQQPSGGDMYLAIKNSSPRTDQTTN